MTIPNLIHPIPVTVELLDAEAAIVDEDFREPLGGGYRTKRFVIPGQVFDQDTINRPTERGLERNVEGYVCFRVFDLNRLLPAGRRIQRNDRIVQFGSGENAEPVDFYFYRKRRRGHYSTGSTLSMWWYAAREPSKTDGQIHKVYGSP